MVSLAYKAHSFLASYPPGHGSELIHKSTIIPKPCSDAYVAVKLRQRINNVLILEGHEVAYPHDLTFAVPQF